MPLHIEVWQARRQRGDTLRALRREHDLTSQDAVHPASANPKDGP